MTEKKWDTLVELLSELANDTEGTWQERKAQLINEFDKRDELTSLEEFIAWFESPTE